MTFRAEAVFWSLVVVFALLVVGTADITARLAGAEPLIAAGTAVTSAVLAWWLVRCLVGWVRARRGDDATLASVGGAAWTGAVMVLAAANAAAAIVLVVLALDGTAESRERAAAAVDLLTVASNVWVLLYYRVARRWNGRRVPHRRGTGGASI